MEGEASRRPKFKLQSQGADRRRLRMVASCSASMPGSLPPSSPLNPHKILVRGVNWLGDAVMSTPALQRLREANPPAHITLLTPHKLAELWEGHPAVDKIMTFGREGSVFQVSRRL